MTNTETSQVAPQEQQTTPETPNFLGHIERLERMALDGIETPNGTESYQFRTGIEVEFALLDPEKFSKAISDHKANAQSRLDNTLRTIETPEEREQISEIHKRQTAGFIDSNLRNINNPDLLESPSPNNTEVTDEFKQYISGFINSLPAANDHEEAKRQKWLAQIPEFGAREVINFMLYEEFSKPTLADNTTPSGTLEVVDQFSETQGWLEFRFGSGDLQTGYYDNEDMCEIRTAPCPPSEAIKRKEIISERLNELASQFGLLFMSSSDHEHINISVYKSSSDSDAYVPIIGNDISRQDKTLDVTAGISKVFNDGLWLSEEDMHHDYVYSKYGGRNLRFGPTRQSVRIMDDRLELRTGFRRADQAVNWLLTGSIEGLQSGHNAINNDSYKSPQPQSIYRVDRNEKFDKHRDLQIQRAFENLKEIDGQFELDTGYNIIRADRITKALLGNTDTLHGSDAFNEWIFSSIEVDEHGRPSINSTKLATNYKQIREKYSTQKLPFMEEFGPDKFEVLTEQLNERFAVVTLNKTEVIAGEVEYKVDGLDELEQRLSSSRTTRLAFGDQAELFRSWILGAAKSANQKN